MNNNSNQSFRDQATLLRMLAHKAVVPKFGTAPEASLAVFLGSRPEIGTSTLTLNVATALADQGKRVVVLDFDILSSGLSQLTGVKPRVTLSSLIRQQHDLHEVLVPGPGGSLLLLTQSEPISEFTFDQDAIVRFGKQIQRLGKHADVVLIDVGDELTSIDQYLWGIAEQFVLVSSPQPEAITQGYAKIKQLKTETVRRDICTVISRCSSEEDAELANVGLEKSCREFLQLPVQSLGTIDFSLQVTAARTAAEPYMLRYPDSIISKQTTAVATLLAQGLPLESAEALQRAA